MRKLDKFVVVFSHESAVYHAGEAVIGDVYIELSEPVETRGVKIELFGRSKVLWTIDEHDIKNYSADEIYINETIYLQGSESNKDRIQLPAGIHRYPFSIALDSRLPSSFEAKYGHVRYTIQATIDRPWKFDYNTRSAFTVISIVDLNTQSRALMEPYVTGDETVFGCCCRLYGAVSATVRLNRRCFVPGETILINAEIVNNGGREIPGITASLIQTVDFRGFCDYLISYNNPKSEKVFNLVAQDSKQDLLRSGSRCTYNLSLFVPSVPPSGLVGCSIINVNYKLKVAIVAVCNDLQIYEDIVIGTVPLREAVYPPKCVVTLQPSTPSPNEEPALGENALPPPSYEECIGGQVSIKEENDSEFLHGSLTYAPKYPVYRQLSSASEVTSPSEPPA